MNEEPGSKPPSQPILRDRWVLATLLAALLMGAGLLVHPFSSGSGAVALFVFTGIGIAIGYASSRWQSSRVTTPLRRTDQTEGPDSARMGILRTAIEQAFDAIVITDAQGTIQFVNPAFTAMTGYTPAEAIGQNPRLLKSGEHDEGFYRALWQTISSGRVWIGEIVNRRKDGTLYSERMSIAPVQDERGAIVSYIAMKHDNSAQQAAERDRRFLASIVDSSQDAILTHTLDGRILTWNHGAESLFGYRKDEAVGLAVTALIGPGLPDRSLEQSNPETAGQREAVAVSKRRRHFPVSVTTSPIRDAANRVVAFSEIVRDISKIRQGEQHQMLLAAIVEASDDAIIATLVDGTIVSWNHGAELVFEYAAEEILGRNVAELVSEEVQAKVPRILDEMRNGRSLVHVDTMGKTRSGRLIDISISASLMRSSLGKCTGISGIARDVTARKRVEAELRNAVEAAESANQAKSDFLANMSHEIRTPMNGVVGMTDLLLRTSLNPMQKRYADALRDSSQALLAVLNDILDFSKIEARKLTLETEDFDLRSVVEGTADLFAVRTQDKGVELLCFTEPSVPTQLRGDPTRVRQILTNLVGNAVKFTNSGHISVRVSLVQDTDPVILKFVVTDTGMGIPAGKQPSLFQPFFQADSSSSRRHSGTGLGLSIVQQLVQLMGGQAGFTSQEHEGSSFWFCAPFGRQGIRRPRSLSLRGRRVLVIVKRQATQGLLAEILSLWQCEFVFVRDIVSAAVAMGDETGNPRWEAVIADIDSADESAARVGMIVEDLRRCMAIPALLLVPTSWGIDEERWTNTGVAVVAKPVKQGSLGYHLCAALGMDPVPGEDREEAIESSPVARDARRAECRVLAVEDNPINQALVSAILGHLGYRNTQVVSDGRKAIEALSRSNYDAVLMDCQMPELDGFETTRLIRDPSSSVRNHDIPVIALTASALAGDRARCLEAGMNDYLAKPIESEAVARVLDHWTCANADRASRGQESVPEEPSGVRVFDREQFVDRLMNNVVLAKRVAGVFVRDMPTQLAALAEALQDADATRIRTTAHSLKGAAATIGGGLVRETASELEALGAAGDLDRVRTVLPRLVQQAEALRNHIEIFRTE